MMPATMEEGTVLNMEVDREVEVVAPPGRLGIIFVEGVVGAVRDTSPLVGQVQKGWLLSKVDGFDVSTLTDAKLVQLLNMRIEVARRLLFRVEVARDTAKIVVKLALAGGQFDVVVPAKKAAADVMVKAWGKKAEADSHVEFKWPDSKTTMIVPVPEGLSVGQSFTIGARLGVGFDPTAVPPRIVTMRSSSRLVGRVAIGAELLEIGGVDTKAMSWRGDEPNASQVYANACMSPVVTLVFATPPVGGVELSYIEFFPRKVGHYYDPMQKLLERVNLFLTNSGIAYTNVETVSCNKSLHNLEKTVYSAVADGTKLSTGQPQMKTFQHLRVWYNKLDPRNTTAKVQNAIVEARRAAEKNMPEEGCAVM